MVDHKVSVFIDSCVWDLLFSSGVNLATALPRDRFSVCMTKQVYDFEIAALAAKKQSLKKYIDQQVFEFGIEIKSFFGCVSYDDKPGFRRRTGGCSEGEMVTYESGILVQEFEKLHKQREQGSGLFGNEADASMAIRCLMGSVVITAESRDGKGPLQVAASRGGKVIFLPNNFDFTQCSLRNLVDAQSSALGVSTLRLPENCDELTD